MSTDEKQVIFQVKDINLAAYLKIKGHVIREVIKEGQHCIFCFVDDKPRREKDCNDFYNDEGGFLTYASAWRTMKKMIHNVLDNRS
jgi:hypothetical protein